MEIISKNIKDLQNYTLNAKKHPEEQIELIKRSIKEFGFKNPVLIDKNDMLIAGHGRVMAAKELGMEEVPCIIYKHYF